MKDTKFKKGDVVIVKKGFMRGFVGELTGYNVFDSKNQYWIRGGEVYYSELDIELYVKPPTWFDHLLGRCGCVEQFQ